MNINEKLLVFKAPFAATTSFEQLKSSKQKGIISILSLGITLSILLVLFYIRYSSRRQHLSFSFQAIPFSLGFIFKIMLVSVTSAILTSRILKCPIKILDNIAIMAVSSLPLIFGSLVQTIARQADPVFELVGLIAFGILASYGVKTFYKQGLPKSLGIIIGILLITKLIELTILGIPVTFK